MGMSNKKMKDLERANKRDKRKRKNAVKRGDVAQVGLLADRIGYRNAVVEKSILQRK